MANASRAVIYVRVSQDRSGEGAGVERQLADCEELAQRRKYNVVERYVENDTSAYHHRKKRPMWSQLVQMVKAGDIDVIVAWHTDRLYRHPKDLEEILDDVVRHVRIDTCRSGELDLATDSGQMVARILGATARQEVARKADRVARANAEKAKAGKYHGGNRALGYERDGRTIRESEAVVLREAARMLLTNVSLSETTRYVNEALDYPNRPRPKKHPDDPDVPRGTPLNTRVLRLNLTSPRIAGLREYWPQADRDLAARSVDHTPSITLYETSDWEPILSRPDWEALRAKFKHDRRRSQHAPTRKALLTGLTFCGHPECDNARLSYNGKSYLCRGRPYGCGRLGVQAANLEPLVVGMVRARLDASDFGALVAPPPTDDVERARQDAQERYDSLLPLYDEGLISAVELGERRARLRDELDRLQTVEGDRQLRTQELAAVVTALKAWDEATLHEKSTLLRALIRRIVVLPAGRHGGSRFDPARVVVEWADGPEPASRSTTDY